MKEKMYSLWAKATDKNGVDHYVTIVGRFTDEKTKETIPTETQYEDENGKVRPALLLVDYKYHQRKFVMARAICDPRDTFDFEIGKQIATKRLDNGDVIGALESRDITMLNEDMCNMLIVNELRHNIEHIDNILPQPSNDAAQDDFKKAQKNLLKEWKKANSEVKTKEEKFFETASEIN